jgi:hypothetical protein
MPPRYGSRLLDCWHGLPAPTDWFIQAELIRAQPLTRRQVLVALERLYDAVLKVEQLRREQPPQENAEAFSKW